MLELLRPQPCTHASDTCPGCRTEMLAEALRQAPGKPIVLLRPAPVRARFALARALAYTVTHVLVEWDGHAGYHLRWEAACLVRRLEPGQG